MFTNNEHDMYKELMILSYMLLFVCYVYVMAYVS